MKVLGRMLCLKTVALAALVLRTVFVKGSSPCEEYQFPCEDGECIRRDEWCDVQEDCYDESDEKYCKTSSFLNKDPNKCPSNYFKCDDGPCIPMVGKCDGFDSCRDSSDEKRCGTDTTSVSQSVSSGTWTTEAKAVMTSTKQPLVTSGSQSTDYPSSAVTIQPSSEIVFSNFHHSDYSSQLKKSLNWLLSQRKSDFGWGVETPRALIALYLSDLQRSMSKNAEDMLMIKQLEVQLSLDLSRNDTKPMKSTDLALYINALQVSCKNPKNFYGEDLVATLRNNVNTAQKEGTSVNPAIYLTLCLNNATTYDDTKKLYNLFSSWNATTSTIDIQALSILTTACIFKKTNFFNATLYESIKSEFLRSVNVHGFPGNVHEAAFVFQALQELNETLTGLIEFILKHQQSDGSFGDFLSTYLVLPILSGRNLVQMSDYCGQQTMPDLIPLEVLKNVKSKKLLVQYSLNYGFPPEVTFTLQMHVANGTNFLNIMRLAQEINPKYRYKLSENREIPVVYSVGEVPNDAEKGMYWKLYKQSENNTKNITEENWVPYHGDIRRLVLTSGDKVLFWYRHV